MGPGPRNQGARDPPQSLKVRHGTPLGVKSISLTRHSQIQVPMRNVQWTFMGGYLNYMRAFVCGNCLAKTCCFLPSIGQLTMPNFFSAKYMFAMVPTKEYSIQNSAFCLSIKAISSITDFGVSTVISSEL